MSGAYSSPPLAVAKVGVIHGKKGHMRGFARRRRLGKMAGFSDAVS